MRTTLLLLALVGVAHSAVFSMPTRRSPALRAKLIEAGTYPDFIARHMAARAATAVSAKTLQPLVDYADDLLVGEISLGTPPQNFTVAVDTGKTDLWVIDALRCKSEACTGFPDSGYEKHQFDMYASSTFQSTKWPYIVMGPYASHGLTCEDVFTIGGVLTSKKQGFGLANSTSDLFGHKQIDGVFGLAWPSYTEVDVPPALWNMLDQLDAPLFTVWQDRRALKNEAKLGGLITYGAIDSEHCDAQIDYVQLSSLTFWQFPITRFSMGKFVANAKLDAKSDTGSSWIGAPTSAIAGIVSATSAKFDALNQLYVVPCKGVFPDMIFTIGGRAYNVPSSAFVADVSLGSGNCALTIFEVDSSGFGPAWILGDTWIRTYCNVHDIGQKRIGFARARHSN